MFLKCKIAMHCDPKKFLTRELSSLKELLILMNIKLKRDINKILRDLL